MPTEETFDLTLFKEVKKESAGRPSMTSKNKWLVPYEGDYKNLKWNSWAIINLLILLFQSSSKRFSTCLYSISSNGFCNFPFQK
ncbi:hypothetical protein QW060_27065 [Myroides ceti]|uniref:Uncharacterized protein n=1 Tax=Paenimyroides ceti TaxID=395087 RepID=A0ABT8D244_9FLAO|nr:hypothetical protein [Paenimyroides ceti]MDN3710471.1 hypothetical protein [Paenimyroides ceti]